MAFLKIKHDQFIHKSYTKTDKNLDSGNHWAIFEIYL